MKSQAFTHGGKNCSNRISREPMDPSQLREDEPRPSSIPVEEIDEIGSSAELSTSTILHGLAEASNGIITCPTSPALPLIPQYRSPAKCVSKMLIQLQPRTANCEVLSSHLGAPRFASSKHKPDDTDSSDCSGDSISSTSSRFSSKTTGTFIARPICLAAISNQLIKLNPTINIEPARCDKRNNLINHKEVPGKPTDLGKFSGTNIKSTDIASYPVSSNLQAAVNGFQSNPFINDFTSPQKQRSQQDGFVKSCVSRIEMQLSRPSSVCCRDGEGPGGLNLLQEKQSSRKQGQDKFSDISFSRHLLSPASSLRKTEEPTTAALNESSFRTDSIEIHDYANESNGTPTAGIQVRLLHSKHSEEVYSEPLGLSSTDDELNSEQTKSKCDKNSTILLGGSTLEVPNFFLSHQVLSADQKNCRQQPEMIQYWGSEINKEISPNLNKFEADSAGVSNVPTFFQDVPSCVKQCEGLPQLLSGIREPIQLPKLDDAPDFNVIFSRIHESCASDDVKIFRQFFPQTLTAPIFLKRRNCADEHSKSPGVHFHSPVSTDCISFSSTAEIKLHTPSINPAQNIKCDTQSSKVNLTSSNVKIYHSPYISDCKLTPVENNPGAHSDLNNDGIGERNVSYDKTFSSKIRYRLVPILEGQLAKACTGSKSVSYTAFPVPISNCSDFSDELQQLTAWTNDRSGQSSAISKALSKASRELTSPARSMLTIFSLNETYICHGTHPLEVPEREPIPNWHGNWSAIIISSNQVQIKQSLLVQDFAKPVQCGSVSLPPTPISFLLERPLTAKTFKLSCHFAPEIQADVLQTQPLKTLPYTTQLSWHQWTLKPRKRPASSLFITNLWPEIIHKKKSMPLSAFIHSSAVETNAQEDPSKLVKNEEYFVPAASSVLGHGRSKLLNTASKQQVEIDSSDTFYVRSDGFGIPKTEETERQTLTAFTQTGRRVRTSRPFQQVKWIQSPGHSLDTDDASDSFSITCEANRKHRSLSANLDSAGPFRLQRFPIFKEVTGTMLRRRLSQSVPQRGPAPVHNRHSYLEKAAELKALRERCKNLKYELKMSTNGDQKSPISSATDSFDSRIEAHSGTTPTSLLLTRTESKARGRAMSASCRKHRRTRSKTPLETEIPPTFAAQRPFEVPPSFLWPSVSSGFPNFGLNSGYNSAMFNPLLQNALSLGYQPFHQPLPYSSYASTAANPYFNPGYMPPSPSAPSMMLPSGNQFWPPGILPMPVGAGSYFAMGSSTKRGRPNSHYNRKRCSSRHHDGRSHSRGSKSHRSKTRYDTTSGSRGDYSSSARFVTQPGREKPIHAQHSSNSGYPERTRGNTEFTHHHSMDFGMNDTSSADLHGFPPRSGDFCRLPPADGLLTVKEELQTNHSIPGAPRGIYEPILNGKVNPFQGHSIPNEESNLPTALGYAPQAPFASLNAGRSPLEPRSSWGPFQATNPINQQGMVEQTPNLPSRRMPPQNHVTPRQPLSATFGPPTGSQQLQQAGAKQQPQQQLPSPFGTTGPQFGPFRMPANKEEYGRLEKRYDWLNSEKTRLEGNLCRVPLKKDSGRLIREPGGATYIQEEERLNQSLKQIDREISALRLIMKKYNSNMNSQRLN